ncbi:hypothetical protein A9264_13075 [Vibrio sp. UCD-FRSSP16_10]|uniref:hypothetical protein n=1 Tax=unclassified Vibrio TaxID=2614977 RepID=UPI0007FE7458|nr:MULTISPECIES: hypothetical protein [unclassified Vibrio]OBT15486.1 hypothetical protein A9260_13290 [Vibrio sp. UCD-FRSSP16_30]OBT20559.1 hypothetical protein A9264_13075 [Vibrio sp. UCD-FRSSP16_10]
MISQQQQYIAYIKANGVGSKDKVADSVKSYLSYLESVQRHLGITISADNLSSDQDIASISERLRILKKVSEKVSG